MLRKFRQIGCSTESDTHLHSGAREDFLVLLPKNSIGAEIGVLKGEFTKNILSIVRPRRLHLIDPYWLVYGERFNWNTKHDEYGRLTTWDAFIAAQKVISKYDKEGICVLHIGKSVECLPIFRDAYFDWVYLDSTHSYEDTMSELELLRVKVSPSGLITGHDWQDDPDHIHAGLKKAVVEFCDRYDWELIVRDHFLNWAIKSRKRKRQNIL